MDTDKHQNKLQSKGEPMSSTLLLQSAGLMYPWPMAYHCPYWEHRVSAPLWTNSLGFIKLLNIQPQPSRERAWLGLHDSHMNSTPTNGWRGMYMYMHALAYALEQTTCTCNTHVYERKWNNEGSFSFSMLHRKKNERTRGVILCVILAKTYKREPEDDANA